MSNITKIAMIGTGAVGSTAAYTLLLRDRMDELVLIDANHQKAVGDALDMNHGMPFLGRARVWAGTYEDCKDADLIIITAGAAQKIGETRLDLLKRNASIFENIIGEVIKYNQDGIFLIATNPVDIMSAVTLKISGFPSSRVIGTGTLLDSARFRYLIGKELDLDPRSIHAHIIGEHGDTELPVWSIANVAGTTLTLDEPVKADIFDHTKNAAYEIIQAKGATFYAIALAIDRIVAAILRNEGSVLNVSTLLENYHGESGVYLGVPCVVDRTGVRNVLPISMSDDEKRLFQASAAKIRETIISLNLH